MLFELLTYICKINVTVVNNLCSLFTLINVNFNNIFTVINKK